MKVQWIDYSGFRLSRIREPRFRHLLLLGGWIFYFAMYFITENLIPLERCHVIHCALDDRIPFNELFVFFYVGWYLLVFGAAVLGLMISALSSTPTTAMTIMPFVLIVQLILSGVLFSLEGATGFFANFTLSKWGMSAFGAEADLNNMNLAINGQLINEGFSYPAQYVMSGQLIKHSPVVSYYDPKAITVLLAWLIKIAITAFNAVVCVAALKLKNRDS